VKKLQKEQIKKVLSGNEAKAVYELKSKLLKILPEAELMLFGSKARGDYDKFSRYRSYTGR